MRERGTEEGRGRGGERGNVGGGGGEEVEEREEHTTLRMSDLGGDRRREEEGEEGENLVDEPTDFESRIQSLQSEVDALTSRLEEEERTRHSVPLTRSRLQAHTGSAPGLVHNATSLMSTQLQGHPSHTREELVNKLEEMEMESSAVSRHVDKLQDAVKKLVRGSLIHQ